MAFQVETRVETRRGCGYRKPGGLYLVADGPAVGCGKLPCPLERCPTCGNGIKPTRGFTWIDARSLLSARDCSAPSSDYCDGCQLWQIERAGLLWIGSVFYKTPDEFDLEAIQVGISRRIAQIPRGFEIGKTWVFLAHRQVIKTADRMMPGIFRAFRPQRIEYVVRPTDSDQKLQRLADRGLTLVDVIASDNPGQRALPFAGMQNAATPV